MFSWLKGRKPKTAPPAVDTPDEAPRLMADGEPSRYVPKDDPQRFAGDPPPLRVISLKGTTSGAACDVTTADAVSTP